MTKNNVNVGIQFIKGENETNHPEIRLFRSIDGKKGKAVYKFFKPSTITQENYNSIEKMYLIDEEGVLTTKKIDLSISENHIKEVTSTYTWNSEEEFSRFIRFSSRYANSLNNN
tara:strand:+ start:37 stop:378 length:342 start_codon:yes stop_codon:yes gene_type:complete